MTLEDQTYDPLDEAQSQHLIAQTLFQISRGLNVARTDAELLRVLAQIAIDADAYGASLTYLDTDDEGRPHTIEMIASWQQDGTAMLPVGSRIAVEDYPVTHFGLANPQEPQMIENVFTDPRVDANTMELLRVGDIVAMVIIPLSLASAWVGLLTFGWRHERQFSYHEKTIYRALVGLASPVVDYRRRFVKQQRQQLKTLYAVSEALNQARSASDIVTALQLPVDQLNATHVLMYYFDRYTEDGPYYADLVAVWHPIDEFLPPQGTRQLLAEPLDEWFGGLDANLTHYFPDLSREATLPPLIADIYQRLGCQACAAIPLIHAGRWLGMLLFSWQIVRYFNEREQEILNALPSLLAPVVDSQRLIQTLEILVEDRTAALQQLSRRLVEVQEQERRLVARELHDEIGQTLTGIKMKLESTTRLPIHEIVAHTRECVTSVTELLTKVSNLALELHPRMLDNYGLVPALRWLFDRFEDEVKVDVIFRHTRNIGRYPRNVELTFYRIAQESLTNVARHANTNKADVRLIANGNSLALYVSDEGRGFDTRILRYDSAGLQGMRERARQINAELEIESEPGQGTKLRLTLYGADNEITGLQAPLV